MKCAYSPHFSDLSGRSAHSVKMSDLHSDYRLPFSNMLE